MIRQVKRKVQKGKAELAIVEELEASMEIVEKICLVIEATKVDDTDVICS
ncbi:MAG: hypothetical protein IJX63_07855 [Lachnospiraceae bacterium]|nr:hypothetical protein [Lachnospiraceae bacterium]